MFVMILKLVLFCTYLKIISCLELIKSGHFYFCRSIWGSVLVFVSKPYFLQMLHWHVREMMKIYHLQTFDH